MVKNALLAVMILWLAGCTAINTANKLKDFENTEFAFRMQLNLSNLEKAAGFVDKAWLEAHPIDPTSLERYQVTDCEVKQVTVSGDRRQVTQEVEIRYFRNDRMIEKSIRHYQTWRFDDSTGNWFLANGLPPFQ